MKALCAKRSTPALLLQELAEPGAGLRASPGQGEMKLVVI